MHGVAPWAPTSAPFPSWEGIKVWDCRKNSGFRFQPSLFGLERHPVVGIFVDQGADQGLVGSAFPDGLFLVDRPADQG